MGGIRGGGEVGEMRGMEADGVHCMRGGRERGVVDVARDHPSEMRAETRVWCWDILRDRAVL